MQNYADKIEKDFGINIDRRRVLWGNCKESDQFAEVIDHARKIPQRYTSPIFQRSEAINNDSKMNEKKKLLELSKLRLRSIFKMAAGLDMVIDKTAIEEIAKEVFLEFNRSAEKKIRNAQSWLKEDLIPSAGIIWKEEETERHKKAKASKRLIHTRANDEF